MDTVTHALLGAAVSDGWFRKRLGPVATPFALAAAALPDLDMFTYFIAPENVWANHRGYTHAFFLMLLAAPVIGTAGYFISKRNGAWRLWTLLALLCLFSHTVIDLVTSWGTMPWLPFSNARVSWDVAPVLDVFMFALTCGAFVANRILRWERVDTFLNPLKYPIVHRHPRRQRAADRVGQVTVVLAVLYLLLGWHQNRQTVRIAREELTKMGVEAVEVRAMPIMFTYIAWHIAARDAEGAIYNAVHSTYAPGPLHFRKYPTLPREDVARILATPGGALFAWYSQNMFVADRERSADGSRIYLRDRRFFGLTRPEDSRFEMAFDEGPDGSLSSGRSEQKGLDGVDVREELRRLWELTWRGVGADTPVAAE